MDGVAAEVAQKIVMFFEDGDVDAGAGKQVGKHHAGGAAADDAAGGFEGHAVLIIFSASPWLTPGSVSPCRAANLAAAAFQAALLDRRKATSLPEGQVAAKLAALQDRFAE
jgi:hypothetical protein